MSRTSGSVAKSAGDGHALPHTSRELMDVALLEFREMHQLQIVVGLLFVAPASRNALHLHAEFDVLSNGQPGEEAMILKDHDAVRARALHGMPSTRIWPEVCDCRPAIRCSRVDFPHPDGPTMQTNSPGRTCRLM